MRLSALCFAINKIFVRPHFELLHDRETQAFPFITVNVKYVQIVVNVERVVILYADFILYVYNCLLEGAGSAKTIKTYKLY